MNAVLGWFKQFSVTQLSVAGVGLLVVVGVVWAWLGKAKMPDIAKVAAGQQSMARGVCARLAGYAKGIWHGFDYLATRREWRYQQPWVLMLGEEKAGKTSLLRSVSISLLQASPAKASELVAQGTEWLFFRGGVIIDPDGKLPTANPGSTPAQAWRRSLSQLKELRPERPLDGLILCISARSLREADVDTRELIAQNLYRQLAYLQERIEFMLPVTVVVTQCDSVDGFDSFWRAQPDVLRSELFGFSANANSQSSAPAEWTDQAFATLAERLRGLQVDAAARTSHIREADAFFLFPSYFPQLRVPLRTLLETVFRQSAWQAGYLLRGIYFTGSVAADGAVEGPARNDIAFVDALVAERVLAERNLARPTRNGLFSRNHLLRAMQITSIAGVVALCVALGFSALRVKSQVATLISAVEQLQRAAPVAARHGDCLGKDEVYPLLVDVSHINDQAHYLAIPASFFDTRAADLSDASIESTAIDKVLMPTFACLLEVRARKMWSDQVILPRVTDDGALQNLRTRFETKLQDVRDLEDNLARYDKLAQHGGHLSRDELLGTLADLSAYVFDAPVPPDVMQERGALSHGFDKVSIGDKVELPKSMRERFAGHIQQLGDATRAALDQEVAHGAELIDVLNRGEEPVLANTRRLAEWLSWTSASWLNATVLTSPCEEIRSDAQPQIDTLVRTYGYAKYLTQVAQKFDAERCFKSEMNALGALSMPPYGNLFTARPKGGLVLSANMQAELLGLPALVQLGFMRLGVTHSFACMAGSEGFRRPETAEAAAYVNEYNAFVKKQQLAALATTARPLYDRLARQALEYALNDSLQRSQIAPTDTPADQVSLESVTRADQQLARMSNDLSLSLDPLLGVLRSYGDLGFAASAATIRQCARNFAAESLSRISALTDSSRLYLPTPATGNDMLFDLGTLPILKEYLSRQVARAQVLAGYATPFMNLLQGSQSVSDAQRSVPQTATFWHNSIDELNRYTLGKEPTGQVANLDNYFMKQLADLSYSNCRKQLATYVSPEYGDDMFSERRRPLEQLVNQRCSNRRVATAMETYNALAQRFNSDLAGRYPFANIADPAVPDARLAAVRSFFLDYDAQRAALGDAMADLTGERWRDAQQFVKTLDAISDFFRSNISAPDASEAIRLSLVFRAQPKQSQGSEQIVAWLLSSGAKAAGFPNRPTTLDWQAGQSLALDLTWASHSSWYPVAEKQQPDLVVEGNDATFVANGTWSLLRFIEAHRTQDDNGNKQLMLGFSVPQQSEVIPGKSDRSRAHLYLGLSLLGSDTKAGDKVLKLPMHFPYKAPGDE